MFLNVKVFYTCNVKNHDYVINESNESNIK